MVVRAATVLLFKQKSLVEFEQGFLLELRKLFVEAGAGFGPKSYKPLSELEAEPSVGLPRGTSCSLRNPELHPIPAGAY